MNIGKLLLVTLIVISSSAHTQGLLGYVKLTAEDRNKEHFDRIIIDIKTDQWLETPPGIETKPYSIGVSAFFYKDLPISKKSNFSVALGIGLSSDNIHHNGAISTSSNNSSNTSYTKLIPLASNYKTKRNKLTLNYIEAPFEIRFRTTNKTLAEKRKFNFRFYPGFKVGYLLGSHTKLVTDNIKVKVYRTPNTLFYRYGPTLRMGVNKVTFVAFYSLTSIFEKNKGNELNTFSLGLSWLMF
jgi:hypothetical protein